MKFLSRLLPLSLFAPMLALAAAPGNFSQASAFIKSTLTFINTTVVPAIFAIALLVFIWGMFTTFILGGSDEGKQEKGKQLMVYAIVGFILMVSILGIVNLITSSLGFQDQNLDSIPNLPSR